MINSWKPADASTPTLSVEDLKEYLMSIFASRAPRPLYFRASRDYALTMAHLANDKKMIDLITALPKDTDWVEVTINSDVLWKL